LLNTGWLHSPAFTRYIGNLNAKFPAREEFRDKSVCDQTFRSLTEKEETGTKGFPALFAPFGFDLCGLLV